MHWIPRFVKDKYILAVEFTMPYPSTGLGSSVKKVAFLILLKNRNASRF